MVPQTCTSVPFTTFDTPCIGRCVSMMIAASAAAFLTPLTSAFDWCSPPPNRQRDEFSSKNSANVSINSLMTPKDKNYAHGNEKRELNSGFPTRFEGLLTKFVGNCDPLTGVQYEQNSYSMYVRTVPQPWSPLREIVCSKQAPIGAQHASVGRKSKTERVQLAS